MHPIILTKPMKAVVIGGGRAAYVKLKRLLSTYPDVTCVSKEFCSEISNGDACCITKDFYDIDKTFFDDFDLIYLSQPYPDNAEDENHFMAIIDYVLTAGKLLSVSSKPELGNFITPATRCDDNVIISVSTSGDSPKQAVKLADSLIKTVKDGRLN